MKSPHEVVYMKVSIVNVEPPKKILDHPWGGDCGSLGVLNGPIGVLDIHDDPIVSLMNPLFLISM